MRNRSFRIVIFLASIIMLFTICSFAKSVDEVEPNNSEAQAFSINVGDTVFGATEGKYDAAVDYYKFKAPITGKVKLTFWSDYNCQLVWVSGNGVSKEMRTSDYDSSNSVSFSVTCGKVYFIQLYGKNHNWFDSESEYHFRVSYVPTKTSITSVKAIKKGFTVKWYKKSSADYYQVQYTKRSTYSKYAWTKGAKIKTYTNTKTIRKLPRNCRYYVRVRTVKKVNGYTYYSPWSKKMAVKTK